MNGERLSFTNFERFLSCIKNSLVGLLFCIVCKAIILFRFRNIGRVPQFEQKMEAAMSSNQQEIKALTIHPKHFQWHSLTSSPRTLEPLFSTPVKNNKPFSFFWLCFQLASENTCAVTWIFKRGNLVRLCGVLKNYVCKVQMQVIQLHAVCDPPKNGSATHFEI